MRSSLATLSCPLTCAGTDVCLNSQLAQWLDPAEN